MENKSEILTKEQWGDLGQLFKGDFKYAIESVKAFLRTPEVKTLANNDLRAQLLLNDIDVAYVIEQRKGILKESIKNKQYSASLKALEGLENHLGLNQKVKITEKRQINSSLQDNYSKAKDTITVETEQSVNNEPDNDKTD